MKNTTAKSLVFAFALTLLAGGPGKSMVERPGPAPMSPGWRLNVTFFEGPGPMPTPGSGSSTVEVF